MRSLADDLGRVFYRPKDSWAGDFIPYYDGTRFRLFFIHIPRKTYRTGDEVWYHVGTRDFVAFDETVVTNIDGGTGSVIRVNGLYHAFYCHFYPDHQVICHATSEDLTSWNKLPGDTFGVTNRIYNVNEWRDPDVFWNEEAREYWMLVASRLADRSSRGGAIALCASSDLHSWRDRGLFYADGYFSGTLECPQLFRIGDWWYLVFSSFTQKHATYYRKSRTLGGPWMSPALDTFDGRAFYAAKTATDGKKRFLFGWNPTKIENLYRWNPPGYPGNDYNTWDFGGHLIVHELYQEVDGTLSVRLPQSVREAFHHAFESHLVPVAGSWSISGGTCATDSSYGFSCLLSRGIPRQFRLSTRLTHGPGTASAGVVLRTDEAAGAGYYISLEPFRNRVVFNSGAIQVPERGRIFPYEVELERPLALEAEVPTELTVLVDDSVCEVYINDHVAMSARMYDLDGPWWGVFSFGGRVTFDELAMYGR